MRPRPFKAVRKVDETGVSGAGHVADGVVFEDGTTVLRWRTECRSTAVYASFADMRKIHGHDGATVFEFDDVAAYRAQAKPRVTEKDLEETLDKLLDKLIKDFARRVTPAAGNRTRL